MARTGAKNSTTPTVELPNLRSSSDFQKDLMKSFEDLRPGQDNEAIRQAVEKILKSYNEQLEALTKQVEQRKQLKELEQSSLQVQQQYHKDKLETLAIERDSIVEGLNSLKKAKEASELAKSELEIKRLSGQATAEELQKLETINEELQGQEVALKALVERRDELTESVKGEAQAVRQIAEQRLKQYQDLQKQYNLEGQKTDSLTKKQQKQVELETKKKKLKEDQAKLIEEINQQEKEGKLSSEEAETERQTVEVKFGKELEKLEHPLGALENIGKAVLSTVKSIFNSMDKGIEQAAQDRRQYQGRVDSRLQGLDGVDFSTLADDASQAFSQSALVNQREYIKNVSSLVDKGIGYNLENRALLETIGEKLVSTFDTLEPTLLRLTRIQQSDLSVSQLGAEAQLTQFLNRMYQDTSYLTDAYDSISGTLLDAASLMSTDQATSFMFDVQKWLGSLYSLGVSQSGVQTIAQGISQLGSGNVSALSSNTPLQTLIVQSLNRAGYNYADILSGGLTSDATNDLLKAMVENLQDIANNTSSNVLKSAWGNIIGLDTTDLRAIRNLTQQDIAVITSSRTNYASAINEAQNQMNQLSNRTFMSEQIDNFVENAFYGIGEKLVNADTITPYLTYKAADLMSGVLGDNLFSQLSTGLLKMGSLAYAFGENGNFTNEDTETTRFWSAVSRMMDGLGAIGSYINKTAKEGVEFISGNATIPGWMNFNQYTSRGDILPLVFDTGVSSNISGLSYSGAFSVSGVEPISQFTENEKVVSRSYETISDASSTITRDASDIYHELFEAQAYPIRVKLADVEDAAVKKLLLNNENYPVDIIDSDMNSLTDTIKQQIQVVKNYY